MAMEKLADQLPTGFAGEWAGSSLQEKQSASQLPGLIILSVLVVFMVLAALYESWSIPFAVMLVVPLGLLGAVVAVTVANMTNDVFFKVGLITLIGLSAKNAILIVEFARQLMSQGMNVVDATLRLNAALTPNTHDLAGIYIRRRTADAGQRGERHDPACPGNGRLRGYDKRNGAGYLLCPRLFRHDYAVH
jgi:predicted ferric reductase